MGELRKAHSPHANADRIAEFSGFRISIVGYSIKYRQFLEVQAQPLLCVSPLRPRGVDIALGNSHLVVRGDYVDSVWQHWSSDVSRLLTSLI